MTRLRNTTYIYIHGSTMSNTTEHEHAHEHRGRKRCGTRVHVTQRKSWCERARRHARATCARVCVVCDMCEGVTARALRRGTGCEPPERRPPTSMRGFVRSHPGVDSRTGERSAAGAKVAIAAARGHTRRPLLSREEALLPGVAFLRTFPLILI